MTVSSWWRERDSFLRFYERDTTSFGKDWLDVRWGCSRAEGGRIWESVGRLKGFDIMLSSRYPFVMYTNFHLM